jgi:hypothetical protein
MGVMDPRLFELRLFDAEGQWVRSIGGRREEPGEFATETPCLLAGPNGEIWISEGSSRLQRFAADGTLVDARIVPGFSACSTRVMSDGRLVILNSSPEDPFRLRAIVHRLGSSGDLIPGDTFHVETPQPKMVLDGQGIPAAEIPFTPLSGFTISPKGNYIFTDFGSYRFHRRTMAGRTLQTIGREHKPVAIPAEVRDRAVENFVRLGEVMVEQGQDVEISEFSAERVPHFYPAFDWIWVAVDGTVWLARTLESGVDGFDLFADDGRFLGSIESPVSFAEARIAGTTLDHIFAIVPDELGMPYIERWSIVR